MRTPDPIAGGKRTREEMLRTGRSSLPAEGHVNDNLATVLRSTTQVFGLLALSYLYCRRFRPDLTSTMKLAMHLFLPCLAFTAILDSKIDSSEAALAAGATCLQIGTGLLLGWIVLRALGWRDRRELLLPIASSTRPTSPSPSSSPISARWTLPRRHLLHGHQPDHLYRSGSLILHGGGRMRGGAERARPLRDGARRTPAPAAPAPSRNRAPDPAPGRHGRRPLHARPLRRFAGPDAPDHPPAGRGGRDVAFRHRAGSPFSSPSASCGLRVCCARCSSSTPCCHRPWST